ncbi:hypothetical protein E2C01_012503 [Portunus trituberculatus]|uniref:Uncharacterized protein n=1 Tax=Portunus trituberculatus TaxID=210409 RepID=A0A5B7DEV8_PORTR|nr:hypothetical protein [Portunus trituberculatus]
MMARKAIITTPDLFHFSFSAAVCPATSRCTDKGGFCSKDCDIWFFVDELCDGEECKCCFAPKCNPQSKCTKKGGYCAPSCPDPDLELDLCGEDCKCCFPPRKLTPDNNTDTATDTDTLTPAVPLCLHLVKIFFDQSHFVNIHFVMERNETQLSMPLIYVAMSSQPVPACALLGLWLQHKQGFLNESARVRTAGNAKEKMDSAQTTVPRSSSAPRLGVGLSTAMGRTASAATINIQRSVHVT